MHRPIGFDEGRTIEELTTSEQFQELIRANRVTGDEHYSQQSYIINLGNNVRMLRDHVGRSLRDITRILETLNRCATLS